MEISVNGEVREAPQGQTVLELLESLPWEPGRLAVELDGQILPRSYWKDRVLHAGARLEIVQFVGGG